MSQKDSKYAILHRLFNWKIILCIFVLLFCEWFFFRNVIHTGWLIGDEGDGRLTMLITEHWWHVFHDHASITDLGIFYPATNTLSYSDMFLGFGIIHSFFRFCGVDMYNAYKATLIIIHFFGTLSLFYLLKKTIKIDSFWSLFGTMAFSFSSSFSLHVCHTQLFALCFLPFVTMCIINFFRNLDNRKCKNIYAFGAISMMLIILYTAWYVAFFAALFIATVLLVFIIWSSIHKLPWWRITRQFFAKISIDFMWYVIFAIVCVTPFIIVELPVLRMSNGYDWGAKSIYLLEPIDLINVSSDNLLMGKLITRLGLASRGLSFEVEQGISVVLLVAFVLFFWLLCYDKLNKYNKNQWWLLNIICWSILISILMPIRFSQNGASLWWFIHKYFPGGSSIRAMGRYILYLSLPLSIITAYMGFITCQKYQRKSLKHRYILCMNGILLILFISNIRIRGVFSSWYRTKQIDFIAHIISPDKQCNTFYIKNMIDKSRNEGFQQLDAHEIADKYKLPTINGYSGLVPNNWDQIWLIDKQSYESSIYRWIELNQLQKVCAYDETNNTWTPFSLENMADKYFNISTKVIPNFIMNGLLDWEPIDDYSWTSQDFRVILRDEQITKNGLFIKVGTDLDKYLLQQESITPLFEVYVNGELINELPVINGEAEYVIEVPPANKDLYDIELKTNFYFNPSQIGESEDNRDLSLRLYYLGAPQTVNSLAESSI